MSGHGSVLHWWMQRITAVLLLPAPFFFFAILVSSDLVEGFLLLTTGYRGVFSALFLPVAIYHGVVGVQVVLEDYVHSEAIRSLLITFFRLLGGATVAAVLIVIVRNSLISWGFM